MSYNLIAIGIVKTMKSIGYKNELNRNGDISLTFIKPLKRIFNRNIKIFSYLKNMQVIENSFVFFNRNNVQIHGRLILVLRVKSLHYKKNYQKIEIMDLLLLNYFYLYSSKVYSNSSFSYFVKSPKKKFMEESSKFITQMLDLSMLTRAIYFSN